MTAKVPYKEPLIDKTGIVSKIWHKWFIALNNLTNAIVTVNPTLPYTVINQNEIIFITTTVAGVVNLLAVEDGLRCRVINTESSTANISLTPNGTDLLYGFNVADVIIPGEARDVDGSTDEGWW